MKAVGWRATFKAFGRARTAIGKTKKKARDTIYADNNRAWNGAEGWKAYKAYLKFERIYVKEDK